MQQMGFRATWINWIMMCVSTVQYSMYFNGSHIGTIIPKRGLWQGDALLVYMFQLYVEGLSRSIRIAELNNRINGCKISHNTLAITHLISVHDNFLFFHTNNVESHRIRDILNSYELLSSKAVNFRSWKFSIVLIPIEININSSPEYWVFGMAS